MMNRTITEYKLIIKVCDKSECSKIDPFGLCYVDDCMSCSNARVKIIRQDNEVMRDDFKDDKNILRFDKLNSFKRTLEREGIDIFEIMYNKKFTKIQRWILERMFNKLSK